MNTCPVGTIMWTTGDFRRFFVHPRAIRASYPRDRPDVVRVCVTPDPAGTYWGWLNTGYYGPEGSVSFVWPKRQAVEMCFTYGPEAETERGRGHIVKVRVEEMDREPY